MIIIYHRMDLDGFTSGAIAKLKYPEHKLVGYHYGDPFDFDQIDNGEGAIMLDVSFTPEDMLKLVSKAGEVIWIDHHVTSINDITTKWPAVTRKVKSVNDVDVHEMHFEDGKLTTYTKVGIAACEIAHLVLFPKEKMTRAISLLGEYDTWRKDDQEKWNNEIMPFQYGMREVCSSPEDFPVHFLTGEVSLLDVDDVIEKGATILSYQEKRDAIALKGSFEAVIAGKIAICCNVSLSSFNSTTFKSVYNPVRHDIMVPFCYTGTHWRISFYTEKPDIDCSAIAKSLGGGGHKGAAGCEVNNARMLELFYGRIK